MMMKKRRKESLTVQGDEFELGNDQKRLYDLHQYIEDPEELSYDPDDPPLILPEVGFRVELGGSKEWEENFKLDIEGEDKHSPYFRTFYENQPHFNFVGGTDANPFVISIKQEERVKKKNYNWRVIIWAKTENHHLWIEASTKQKVIKKLKVDYASLLGVIEVQEVKQHDQLVQELVHMEDRLLIKAYKFGVVYCKPGQTDECEMFSNQDASPEFEEFMNSIGKKSP